MSKSKPQLREQDLGTLDVTKLTPLSPEIISRQATINIGTIGHVAHGKSTVVKAISGVQTVRFKNELERNITIKLGYANAKIFKCSNEKCERPACYRAYGSSKEDNPPCEICSSPMELLRHVSFVDCFGVDTAFATTEGTSIVNRDLRVGDKLMGPDGQPRTVLTIKEGEKELYEIAYKATLTQGLEEEKFTCTGGHLLCLRIDAPVDAPVLDRKDNVFFVRQYIGNSEEMRSTRAVFETMEQARAFYEAADKSPVEFEMTVESFLAAPESVRSKTRLYRAPALIFGAPVIDLTIGEATEEEVAWLVGLWLGNGDAVDTRFTLSASVDKEILERVTAIATKMGLAAVVGKCADRDATYVTLSAQSGLAEGATEDSNALKENAFYLKLSELGVVGAKHVPSAIQSHTVAVRHAVLAGVFDAEGTYADGQFDLEFSAKTGPKLFHTLVWLIRSLGFTVRLSRREVTVEGVSDEKLHLRFNGSTAEELPIVSPLKVGSSVVRACATSQQFTVTPIGSGAFRGFEVDGDGRVLLADFTVAHNCPGHDILMATMLNGAAVMDGALLLIAANETCPQPQTAEHLAAVEIMKLKDIIILQNKIDLITESNAMNQHDAIKKFIEGTVAEAAPVVPISAQLKYNVDVVCEYIVKKIPVPVRDFVSPPQMIVIRSFDVNKPGSEVEDLKGGVAGGSILQGVLRLGQEVEIRPGIITKDAEGRVKCVPLFSKIVSLFAETNELQYAAPGGLIGVGLTVDPTLTRADRLVGQVLGEVGNLPEVFAELEINFFLLRRLLGVRSKEGEKADKVTKLLKGEVLMLNIGSMCTGARVLAVKADLAKLQLTSPVCTKEKEKVALSRRVEKHWRLIGWGQIQKGLRMDLPASAASTSA